MVRCAPTRNDLSKLHGGMSINNLAQASRRGYAVTGSGKEPWNQRKKYSTTKERRPPKRGLMLRGNQDAVDMQTHAPISPAICCIAVSPHADCGKLCRLSTITYPPPGADMHAMPRCAACCTVDHAAMRCAAIAPHPSPRHPLAVTRGIMPWPASMQIDSTQPPG